MIKIYGYPKCSSCKKASAWLERHQIDFERFDIIQQPPTPALINEWMTGSELPMRRFFNTSGKKYRELGLKDKVPELSQKEACELLATDGMLIKRPVLVKDGKVAALGFKEADYEGVFQ